MQARLAGALLVLACDAALAATGTSSPSDPYIEFLWSKTPEGALARQETRSFVLGERFGHQVCVAVLDADATTSGLTIEMRDTAGRVVAQQAHPDFDGSKRCFPAQLPPDATPGTWRVVVYLDGAAVPAGSREVEVYPTLDALIAATPQDMPYVLGRPNYDATIAPEAFVGELAWVMHIARDGSVDRVEVERAEGIGLQIRDRAIRAGEISLFPPRSGPDSTSTFRRQLSFRNDE